MSGENVARLRPEDEVTETENTPAGAPALGFSVRRQLGEGSDLVLQTHVANDVDLPELNKMIDKMAAAADRQVARAGIAQAEDNIVKLEETMADAEANVKLLDEKTEKDLAELESRTRKYEALKGDKLRNAEQAHEASNRRGAFELKGEARQVVGHIDSELKKTADDVARLTTDRDQGHQTHETNMGVFRTRIAREQSRIARLRKVLGE